MSPIQVEVEKKPAINPQEVDKKFWRLDEKHNLFGKDELH